MNFKQMNNFVIQRKANQEQNNKINKYIFIKNFGQTKVEFYFTSAEFS